MKQILQHLGTGATEVADVPAPRVAPGQLLIRTSRTLISAGTERMLLDFGKANPIAKARQQPEKVKQVLQKVRTDGLLPTIAAVRNKLDQPLALGYCNVGRVLELGAGTGGTGFAVGQRVASNGKHAEVVGVPVNLCAPVPDSVGDDEAAFTVVGAIALQGIRLAAPTLGEAVVVTGLGLIGQITVQLLRAHGCRVLGIDFDASRLALARRFGAETVDLSAGEDPVAAAERFSRGRGVDAVLVTAATKSSEPMHQAARMCRQRGRIVLIGVTGLELSRDEFFKKELTFQVSCSYGPGRYDVEYEERGHDYPVGFVRWTEQRNFEAVLDMLADGRLDVAPLVSHRFALDEAPAAYAVVGGSEPSLGILLEYASEAVRPDNVVRARSVALRQGSSSAGVDATTPPRAVGGGGPAVAFIGAGNYGGAVLIPAFKAAGARLTTVVSSAGVSGVHAGRQHGFAETGTDAAAVLRDPAVDAVVVTTRHDSHARFVIDALGAGKHVFVEKPLCLTDGELESIQEAYAAATAPGGKAPVLMVGFNRRFSPLVVRAKQLLHCAAGPKAFTMTVNAGAIPADHWTQDASVGGGRIVGEACHFIDLLRHLADQPIVSHSRLTMAGGSGDTATLELGFADGSIGTIHYFANGSKALAKERLEVFSQGRVLQLDNFRVLRAFGWPGFRRTSLWRQDKGQGPCAAAFLAAVAGRGGPPIAVDELFEVSRVSIALGAA